VWVVLLGLLLGGSVRAEEACPNDASSADTLLGQINQAIARVSGMLGTAQEQKVKMCIQDQLTSMQNTLGQIADGPARVRSCADQGCCQAELSTINTGWELIQTAESASRKCSGESVRFGSEGAEAGPVTEDPDRMGADPQNPSADPSSPVPDTGGDEADNTGDQTEDLNGSVTGGPGEDTVDDIAPSDPTPQGSEES